MYDVCAPPDPWHPDRIYPLKMMLDQVTTIQRSLGAADPLAALLEEFPELLHTAREISRAPAAFALEEPRGALVGLRDLLAKYAAEWQRFPYRLEAA